MPSNGPSHGAKRAPAIRQIKAAITHHTHHASACATEASIALLPYQGMQLPASDTSTAVSAVGDTSYSLPLPCTYILCRVLQRIPAAFPARHQRFRLSVPVEGLRATEHPAKASACLFIMPRLLPNACESLWLARAVSRSKCQPPIPSSHPLKRYHENCDPSRAWLLINSARAPNGNVPGNPSAF